MLMVGIGLVPVGASKFLHIDYSGEPIQLVSFLIAGATLLVMVALMMYLTRRIDWYAYVPTTTSGPSTPPGMPPTVPSAGIMEPS